MTVDMTNRSLTADAPAPWRKYIPKKRSAIATMALGLAASAVIASPAAAASCSKFYTDTGGGLQGGTYLQVCGTGNYVTSIQGWHVNGSGSYAHTGHVRLSDNNGSGDGDDQSVPPGWESSRMTWTYGYNLSSGTRLCSQWIIAGGYTTPGRACYNVGDWT